MMNLLSLLIISVLFCALQFECQSFSISHSSVQLRLKSLVKGRNNVVTMEYIPDGLTKKQWDEMKRKEEEENKKKNLGAIGITKFQSRSFEAWQKSGGKNLFPVDPNSPLESKPYMQRPGGSSDGVDLKQKGLKGVAQGRESARSEVDNKYEKLAAEGKLRSSPFSLPWTNDDVKKMAISGNKDKTAANPKAVGAKPSATPAAPVEEPKKKGFFGLF